MTLEIVIPEAGTQKKTAKDMVFSILVEDKAKTLTQLHRELIRKYHVSVSFQAVMKAVHSLLFSHVLVKEGKVYSLNKDWIFETRNFFDRLYTEHFKVKRLMKRVELGKEIAVYTVHNLLELDRLWNDILTQWAKEEQEDKRNCWMGRHAWWLIPRLQEEDTLHDFMIERGVKTYNVWRENAMLDKIAAKYYSRKNEFAKIMTRIRLPKDSHIAAFGANVIKFEIPHNLSEKLEKIYHHTKKLGDLDIKHAIDVFKENAEIEFTVIKDKFLADKVKEEVISHFKA